jgi:Tfp pilus assembly ATPase PilU
MQTLDQAMVELVKRNVIDSADARAIAVNKDMFA